ncbi:MAG TPA: tetratricopeptide repeat protein [Thermomicrobiaceae bacterium]|nr:tetratricopeptide repeat protein [Thermomicrobiaceae bacterium]
MASERESEFGELLRSYRVAAGLTQEELAERAGISARAVSDLERGVNRVPRRDTLGMLVDALQLPRDERARWEGARRRLAVRPAPQQRPATAAMGNLPAPVASVIGRESETGALVSLLGTPDVRLVTVTGPAGVGKTTVALAVARRLGPAFSDGCYVVAVAGVRESRLVPAAIAAALAIPHGEGSVGDIVAALRSRQFLLLIDNFEQLLEAAPDLSRLLYGCPGLKLLVTSRARLRLSGEREFQLAPLPLPGPDQIALDAVARSPAVALFVERAQAVKPGFGLNEANAGVVLSICRRLDGLPLAVELAAPWLKTLSPAALLSRLEHHRLVLASGARDLPERLQTLRGAIAWSFELLHPEEQRVFTRLAVFRAGCTLEAAEAVAGADNPADLPTILAELIDKSLLIQAEDPEGLPRFSMLETIHEYAEEQLATSGEGPAVRQRLVAFFRDLVEQAELASRGPEQGLWLRRLTSDYDNLRAALEYTIAAGYVDDGCRLAGALWRYWYARGAYAEGTYWLERVLGFSRGSESAARAKCSFGTGVLAEAQGDFERARARLLESATAFAEQGEAAEAALATAQLGLVERDQGDTRRAGQLLEQSLAKLSALGDTWGAALVRNHLGAIAVGASELAVGEAWLRESLRGFRAVPDLWGVALVTGNLGTLALRQGDVDRAAILLEETLSLQEHLGERRGVAITLGRLARLSVTRDDLRRARRLYLESLSLQQEMRDDSGIASTLERLAQVQSRLGQPSVALRYASAATRLRAAIGVPLTGGGQLALEKLSAELRTVLGDDQYEAAWRAGQTDSLAGLMAAALADQPGG